MKRLAGRFRANLVGFLTSVRLRITLWFVAILAIILVVFSAFIYIQQGNDLRAASLSRLETKFAQLQALVQVPPRDALREGRIMLPSIPNNGQPLLQAGDVMAITDPNGSVVQSVGPMQPAEISVFAQQEIQERGESNPLAYTIGAGTEIDQGGKSQYYFLLAPVTFAGTDIGYLVLGSPVDPSGELRRLLLTLLLGSIGTLVIALLGGFWLADRAMRPVKTITQTARRIGETDLSRRLNLGRHDELGELADTFDEMLGRLQAAFDRQRRFTADASHELRTPLTIINLETSRALANKHPSKDNFHALQVIHTENEFMTRLVNNLLTLSRMDAGQTALQMEPLDLSDIALDVAERLTPLAARSGVSLSAGELPEVHIRGDQQYLTQMITNLVENAIKYSRNARDPEVCLETGCTHDAASPMAFVRVSDNGPGIPPEHLPHLFERFYQADSARTKRADLPADSQDGSSGTGLGLSIVEWVAKAHGGTVQADSELARGSTFEVHLPVLSET